MLSGTVLGIATFAYLAAFVLSLTLVHSTARGNRAAAWWATCAGFMIQSLGMALRWWESYRLGVGHVPLSNFYESLVFFAWAIVVVNLALVRGRAALMLPVVSARAAVLALATGLAAGLLGYASFAPQVDYGIKPLMPALKSNWLAIHVMTCFLGYAAFVLASLAGLFGLKKRRNDADASGLEELFSQTLAAGFILFTLGIMTGSVWAYQAWGRYWGWDPKETWALITWLIYAAVIHERLRCGNVSRRVVILALIGLLSVFFTYIGVNYLPGLHSYL